ncbi:MAG: hypothetical protein ACOVOV_04540 [Dolichospermum sp.]
MLTVAAIITAWGNYYKPGGIGPQDITRQILTSEQTQAYFPLRSTDKTQIDSASMKMGNVTQPFYKKFSHLGTLDFKPHKWDLDRVKINIEMTPDDLAATALDFWAPKGVYKKEAPIVQMIGDYIMAKHKEENEETIIFKGVRKDVSNTDQGNRVPGLVIDSRTGIRHKIRLRNAAGMFADLGSMIAMGAVPTDPVQFVTYIETFFYSIPEKYREYIKEIIMNTTLEKRFKDGMRLKYNTYFAQTADLATIIDTNVKIIGLISHNGSNMIWCTIEGNRRGHIKNPDNKGIFNIEAYDTYNVRISTDWYQGEDFYTPELVWTNGQDLTLPS